MDFNQFFEASTEQEWKEKITKDLKGGNIEDLIWQSEIGPIDPILFSYENKYGRIVPKPDQEDNSWEIAASFDCSNATQANKAILEALAGGVNHIRLFNCSANSLTEILNDVILNIIKTTIFCDSNNFYPLTAKLEEINAENVVLTASPITKSLKSGSKEELEANHFTVNGAYLSDLGLNNDHQIGMMLAIGHEHFLHLTEKGQSVNQAAANVNFDVGIGNSYFAEIAKVGALRLLWDTLLTEYGVDETYARIHARTSNFNYSNLDIHNNLLRATTAAMAGSIAGVESIEVLPYDHNLSDKYSDGQRLAKNIQLLLQEESYFNQVKDAAAGSYYIEQLTDVLIEKSWDFFQQVDRFDSFDDAVQQGFILSTIQTDVDRKKELLNTEGLKLVGVNFQPNASEKRTEEKADENLTNANRLAQFNA